MKLFLPALLLAAVVAVPAPLLASAPTLRLACGTPSTHEIVSCRLSGHGFTPREQVRVTYTLTFTALPRRAGKLPQHVYRRTAVTDRSGSFTRPPLGFAVVKYHESFRLTVTAVGGSGDRAAITTVAIAN